MLVGSEKRGGKRREKYKGGQEGEIGTWTLVPSSLEKRALFRTHGRRADLAERALRDSGEKFVCG